MSKFYRNGRFFSLLTKGNVRYLLFGLTGLSAVCLGALLLVPEPPEQEVSLPADPPAVSSDSGSVSGSKDPTTDSGSSAPTDTEGSVDLPAEDVTMILPVSGTVKTDFSLTVPVFSATMEDWRVHQGIDYLTESETEVVAVADGVVDQVYVSELMGLTVEILHADGTRSIYQSLGGEAEVIAGQEVLQGDRIGQTGTSADSECLEGTHLHFALLRNGVYLDPNDRFAS